MRKRCSSEPFWTYQR